MGETGVSMLLMGRKETVEQHVVAGSLAIRRLPTVRTVGQVLHLTHGEAGRIS